MADTSMALEEIVFKEGAITISKEQYDTFVQSITSQNPTPPELKLYFYDCARRGVHPLDKLIYFTKRKDKSNPNGKYTPITGIDYMRIRAESSGTYAGSDEPEYGPMIKDGNISVPQWARVTVLKMVSNQRCPFVGKVLWNEIAPDLTNSSAFMWRKMPFHMLAKCAEANALRKAFPGQLHGLYISEEMDQAGFDTSNSPSSLSFSGGVISPDATVIDNDSGNVVSPNGQPPKETAPVRPAPRPAEPATTAAPVPQTIPEPTFTTHETIPITVSIWNGTSFSEKPSTEAIDEKAKNWFVNHFIGNGKVWEYAPAFWGSDKPKEDGTLNPGHLGKHFGRHNLIDPKSPFTYDQFASLVGYCWHNLGDQHGWLDPRFYQDKINEEANKTSKDDKAKDILERTDPNAIITRASLMLVPIVNIAKDAYSAEWKDLTPAMESLSILLDMVEAGKIGRDDFGKMTEMLKAG